MTGRFDQAAPVRPVPIAALPLLRALTVAELLAADIPTREMVLAPVLPTQGLALLYAQRGVGKTYLALSIAYAVASGGRVLRWAAPKARRVLYLDGEMPASAMQERMAAIVAGSATAPPSDDYLRIVTPDLQDRTMPDLGMPKGQAEIEVLLDGVELVVIDNISTLVRSGVENEAESWIAVQGWALRLRRQGKAVLFVHHAGKGGQQRGTSKREDVLDTVISLRRREDYNATSGAEFIVHVEKGRGVHGDDARPFEARLETRDGAAAWTCRDLEQSGFDRVTAYLREGYSQKEIAEVMRLHKSTVSRHAKRAINEGLSPEPKRSPRGRTDD